MSHCKFRRKTEKNVKNAFLKLDNKRVKGYNIKHSVEHQETSHSLWNQAVVEKYLARLTAASRESGTSGQATPGGFPRKNLHT